MKEFASMPPHHESALKKTETPENPLRHFPKSDPRLDEAAGPLDEMLRIIGSRVYGDHGSIVDRLRWYRERAESLDPMTKQVLAAIEEEAILAEREMLSALQRLQGMDDHDWREMFDDHLRNLKTHGTLDPREL